jgi:hypothetical protein
MGSGKGLAGASTREMASRRHKARVWFSLLMTGAVALILVAVSVAKAPGIGGGLAILALLIAARWILNYTRASERKMKKEERRAVRGARAEEKIGAILGDLGEGWLVMHDVPSPYGNIDHIVINRRGAVYLLETKAHGGRVSVANGRLLVNGHEPEKDFVAQALRNTYWLRDTVQEAAGIEAWITPLLVFTNAFVERTAPVKNVEIVNKKYLLSVLGRPTSRTQDGVWESKEMIRRALIGS